jgi:hypothetical protein
MTDEEWEEAVLACTSPGDQWKIVQKGLSNEIYNAQANALDAADWGKVCELRGFAQGLAFMIGLRDNVKLRKQQRQTEAAYNADV